ncbi:MAG TPA: HD domain-containing phosphohydrolase [Vicinamibacterales bacterium]|nr:HD domain-containing phosphohydrolase [Vicinamibacterales bacterium]
MSATPTPRRPPSRALIAFTTPIIAIGALVVVYSAAALPSTAYPVGWISLGVLALLAATFALKVPGVSAHLSISDTFFFTSVLLFGPAPATVAIALDSLVMTWRRRHRRLHLLFNPTSSALSLWAGAQLYYALSGASPLTDTRGALGASIILPLAAMACVYFLLNSGMTAVALSLDKRIPAITLWRDHFAIISLNYFAAASASFFLIVLIRYAGLTAIAAVMPLICICYLAMRSWLGRVEDAQKHVTKINGLYLSTIDAFSTAIEAKDGVTSDHIHRVQAYALGLARALGITDADTLQAIEAAALLHDTGKLAVPEHILNKPGKLTVDEFETMKLHVEVGADILSSIEFPYPVVPIVRAHHENWDGTGYPAQLRGEDIPIGARILSVVDCFDALTSDRPYRKAMTEDAALQIVIERRGTMYDPAVVDTFLRVHRAIAPAAALQPGVQHAVSRIRRAVRTAAPVERAAEPADTSIDGSEEMLAFVSLARVASRTSTVGDIGSLAWGHLRQLAPGATLAIYTIDAARASIAAAYTAGPAAAQLAGHAMGVGERVSGWVAANGRAMENAQAELDLPNTADRALQFMVAVPLVANGGVVAVMTLYAAEAFAEERCRRLELIAPHFATAMAAGLADSDSRTVTTDASRAPAARHELRVVSRS